MLFRSLLKEEGEQGEAKLTPPSEEGKGGLWQWVGFSGFLHCVIVATFLLVPHTPFSRTINYPIYTVDLVGGEKIGGRTRVAAIKPPPATKKIPKRVKTKPRNVQKKAAPRPVKTKKEVKKIEAPEVALVKKPAKRKKLRKKAIREPRQVALQGTINAEVKKPERPKEGISGEARKKLILAAVERVKLRAEEERIKKEQSDAVGDLNPGEGAVALGKNGRGGGVVKGFEFLVYRNRMLHLIKEQWTWVGKVTDLEVTVRFGILENGKVIGLRVVEGSGDPSYDDSVLRAMRKAAPLPPPPDDYRKDFMSVELTFRPKDLRG